jgi:hypothetical protein
VSEDRSLFKRFRATLRPFRLQQGRIFENLSMDRLGLVQLNGVVINLGTSLRYELELDAALICQMSEHAFVESDIRWLRGPWIPVMSGASL